MDEPPELTCNECELRYNVIWSLDAAGQGGWRPVSYCPRCGSTDITLPPTVAPNRTEETDA